MHDLDLNAQIASLRQCLPDVRQLNLYLNHLTAPLHPIACDYLDHAYPPWRVHRAIAALQHPHRARTWGPIHDPNTRFEHRLKPNGTIGLLYTYAPNANIHALWTPGARVRIHNPFGYAYFDDLAAHLVGIDLACHGTLSADLDASQDAPYAADLLHAMRRAHGRWRWTGAGDAPTLNQAAQ